MNEIELQISQFIDNELDDNAQKKLFEVLAEDKNARQILSDYMQLKKGIADHHGSIVETLHPIPVLLKQSRSNLGINNNYRTMFYISAAAAVLLAMLLFTNRNGFQDYSIQSTSLQREYESLKNENARLKKEKIFQRETNEGVSFRKTMNSPKKAQRSKKYMTANSRPAEGTNRFKRLAQISEVIQANKAVITKDDFIGGQIVGN